MSPVTAALRSLSPGEPVLGRIAELSPFSSQAPVAQLAPSRVCLFNSSSLLH